MDPDSDKLVQFGNACEHVERGMAGGIMLYLRAGEQDGAFAEIGGEFVDIPLQRFTREC